MKYFNKAYELDKKNVQARFNLATCCQKVGKKTDLAKSLLN